MEVVGPSKRKYSGIVIQLFWCLGLFVQAAVAYTLRDWRSLTLALSVPTLVFLSYWWSVPSCFKYL